MICRIIYGSEYLLSSSRLAAWYHRSIRCATVDVIEICCYKNILCPYGDTHFDVAYESWIYHMSACYIRLLYCMDIWILVDMVATKLI